MKIAITGAKGIVGSALITKLDTDKFNITELDLPEHDVSDLDSLTETTRDHDAIIHLAWNTLRDNYTSGRIDPINDQMIYNAYQAAVTNKVPRVIMASSNHAHRHDKRDADGKIRATINPPVPDSPYGAEKVFMEALGRYFATTHNLQVICLRIGNVNAEDKPQPSRPDDPTRWLSHADLARLVTCCLETENIPDNFQIIYGVSKQSVFDWSNPLGYEPQDSAE